METWTLPQARRHLWDSFRPGPVRARPWREALGLILAEDVVGDVDFPPYPRMAMDGYAVRAADVAGADPQAPVALRVVGEAAAGRAFPGEVQPGEAVKAMTGAPLPAGADCVVPIERTSGWSEEVATILAPVASGQHVAPRGEDLRAGEVVLGSGVRLGAHHVQALLSAGVESVPVFDPPSVGVFATGDELVPPSQRPGPSQIRESNSGGVRAILAGWGIEAHQFGRIGDTLDSTIEAVESALAAHEILVLSGGVSMGEHDHVKPALRACGVRLDFESLHLKPGHPTTYGRRDSRHVFALPGNPVAVFVTLTQVFGPGLRRRLGYPDPEPRARFGRLAEATRRRGPRPLFRPVRLEAQEGDLPLVHALGHHGSGDFLSLARADALAFLPAERDRWDAGEVVRIHALPPGEPG